MLRWVDSQVVNTLTQTTPVCRYRAGWGVAEKPRDHRNTADAAYCYMRRGLARPITSNGVLYGLVLRDLARPRAYCGVVRCGLLLYTSCVAWSWMRAIATRGVVMRPSTTYIARSVVRCGLLLHTSYVVWYWMRAIATRGVVMRPSTT